ncbi:hypothetical protein [uncultured Microbulbifer sp.]|nr:hypothetical protein [uncultured Microbulbifer sp.]
MKRAEKSAKICSEEIIQVQKPLSEKLEENTGLREEDVSLKNRLA